MKFCILLFSASTLLISAKKEIDWKIAKVLDSASAKSYVTSGASTSTTSTGNGDSVSDTRIHTITMRDTQLMLVGPDFIYVVEDTRAGGATTLGGLARQTISNRHHGCRFIVGDSIKYYQEKSALHVLDADGKQCRTEVLRQERLK